MKHFYKHLILFQILLLVGTFAWAQGPTRVNEDFDVSLTPVGWTNALNTGSLLTQVTNVQSYGRTGTTAAVRSNNFTVASGSRATLETPTFAQATVSGDTLRFDVAHATRTGIRDSLIVWAFNGVSYNRIAAWGSNNAVDLNGITTVAATATEFVPTATQWLTKKVALPVGTTKVQFEMFSGLGNHLYLDRVLVDSVTIAPMLLSSITASHPTLVNTDKGATNVAMIGVTINVTGNTTPLSVSSFSLNTTGTTAINALDSAKIFYTGSNNAFVPIGRFGAFNDPNGSFAINGSQVLAEGINHFWLVYDLNAWASTGAIDAECLTVTISGTPQTPPVTAPTGERNIVSTGSISISATAGAAPDSWSTLSGALSAINRGIYQGDVSIFVNRSTTETVSGILDSSGIATGANYTSVRIQPADTATTLKEIATSVVGLILFDLRGADNVKVDGRAMATGSTRLLNFRHTAITNTSSITMRLINGASNCNFAYTGFLSANSALAAGLNVQFSTSAATTGNQNDTMYYCFVSGGRNNISIAGTAANPMNNIIIRGCAVLNHGNVGIGASAVNALTIDSNVISQTVGQAAASIGINLTQNINGSVFRVTRNRIQNLLTSSASAIVGMQYSPSLATPTVTPILHCYNNFISLPASSGGAVQVIGFTFAGTQPGICNFVNNSIFIGGTHIAVSANPGSIGINKTNPSVASIWRCRNNVSMNTRLGGGVFHVAGWVSGSVASQAATYDVDYNNYFSTSTSGVQNTHTLYTIPTGTFFYSGIAGYRADANPREQHSQFSQVFFVDSNNLSVTGASVNNYAVMGAPRNASVTTDIFENLREVSTYKGAHAPGPFTNLKDATVKEVYTLGKIPIPYSNPHTIRTGIINTGIDTLFNLEVNLAVTGANTFTDQQFIDTLAPEQAKTVIFNSLNYLNTGNCTVTVSVPNDSTNSNNSKVFNQQVTNDVYAYAEPGIPSAGGVGFNGISGDFVAKFPLAGANNINQVGVTFNAGGQPYQIVIYDMLNDTPGTLLWNSATNVSVTGVNTIPVIPSVGVSGSFFVGVRQTGTTNVGFGYQAEDPIRNNTFYYKASNVFNWADFATTNSAFRFMVEPRLQVAEDVGASKVISPCMNMVQGAPPVNPQIQVLNYGLNTQDTIAAGYSITGPVSISDLDTFNLAGFGSGQSATLNFGSLFNPTTPGTYTMKAWSSLINTVDGAKDNDTLTYTFVVMNANNYANAGNALTFNGTSQFVEVSHAADLQLNGNMITVESWVNPGVTGTNRYVLTKDDDFSSSGFVFYVNGSSQPVFRFSRDAGTDSLVSSISIPTNFFSHIAAVYDGNTNTANLYVNGNLAATKLLTGNLVGTTTPLWIGKGRPAGSFFSGSIDEVKIWDTARTEHQIRMSMHTRAANFAHPDLIAYYRMDSSGLNSITDAAGRCLVGMLNNAPTFTSSAVLLGAPVVATQNVTTSGNTAFGGTNLSIETFNQAGTNDYYVHLFDGVPVDVLPSTTPGGVTTIHPKNWIVYRYGAGTIDSSTMTFTVTGITGSSIPEDFFMYTRLNSSRAGWTTVDTANLVNSGNNTVTFKAMPSNYGSQFSVGANNNLGLPVELLYLTATAKDKDAQLKWSTASELDNSGFYIERSVDGKRFSQIDFVEGKGTTMRQSNYTYNDLGAFKNNRTLYYRLVQTDFSGKQEVSRVVSVTYGIEKGFLVAYPNPFNDQLSIDLDSEKAQSVLIKITDLSGRSVYEENRAITDGPMQLNINGLSELKQGAYLCIIELNGSVRVQKIMKQ